MTLRPCLYLLNKCLRVSRNEVEEKSLKKTEKSSPLEDEMHCNKNLDLG